MLIRNDEVNILRYLPNFLSKDKTFENVGNICSNEHETLRILVNELLNQMFVITATWGLDEWERVLDIKTVKTDTYSQRRNRILIKLQSNQTSTLKFMTDLASRYYIKDAEIEIQEYNTQNKFKLIADKPSFDYTGLLEAIETYKPAHLQCMLTQRLKGNLNFYYGCGIVGKHRKTTINCGNIIEFKNQQLNITQKGIVTVHKKTNIRSWE